MKNILKRTLTIVIAVAILTGFVPWGAMNFAVTASADPWAPPQSQYWYNDFGYNLCGDGTVMISQYKYSGQTNVSIPEKINELTVSSIGQNAFYYCSELKSITIPNSVTSIGENAFLGCTDLTSITIDKDNKMFDSRNNCNAIIKTETNTLIRGCKSTIIPDSVTSIEYNAFSKCTGLTSITIPNSVTNIGDWAFSGCTGLTSVKLSNNVKIIEMDTFSGCTNLKSIIIPDSVERIEECSFSNCENLSSVSIGNGVVRIGEGAFSGTGLTSITIPDNVKRVCSEAFSWCTKLTNVIISNGVVSIGEAAFSSCVGLKELTMPCSLIVDDYAFSGCKNTEKITLTKGTGMMECFSYHCGLFNNNSVKEVVIEDGVKNICDSAFSNWTVLSSIIIPNSVTSIGDYAFEYCTGLTSITIPNSVTSIGNYAFRDCTGLTSITVDNDNKVYDSRNNCNAIIETATNTLICGCKNTVIPNSVMSIGDYAFYNCYDLISITIPNGVTSIGDYAFEDCTGLTSITIGNSVTNIGESAFHNTAFYNDSANWENDVLYIGNYLLEAKDTIKGEYKIKDRTKVIADGGAFYKCTGLTSITIPNSVTSIGWCAFGDCTGLTSIIIPDSVTSIDCYAFYGCTGLTSITIPDSVTSVDSWVFEGCTGLTSITIPDSVTSIDSLAFKNCTSLTSITIPNSVTSIGYAAFYHCNELKDVYYIGTEEQWNSIDIEDYNECLLNATIHFNCTPSENYTVTFDPNGGSVSPASETSDESVILPTPTRDGYTCLGWSEDSKATDAAYLCGAEYKPQSDITLYAVWKANSYTIKFYDGSTLLGSKSLKFDESGTLSYGKVPVKEGYHFVGWSTIKGGPALFGNGQSIKGLTANDGAIVSYYAVWEKDENEVITDKDTGIVLDAPADAFEGNPTLKIDTVLSGSAFDIVSNQVDGLKCSVFSIETYVDGVKTQPNGYVTVKIPVPDGFDAKKCKLYYVNTNKNVAEEIKIQIVNNFIVFQTNHFSDWAVVETKGKVNSVSLGDIELNYKSTGNINPTIDADSGVKYKIEYKSSNTNIATVDNNGTVYAAKKGNATITCTVTDEYGNQVSDTCNVTVGYTWWQWIIKIVLFGWIWY